MKSVFTLLATVLLSALLINNSLAQTNTFPTTGAAGIGTLSPNASSLLDITSTTKGILIPRMTKAKRDVIVSPATGLMIYQTNSIPGFYYYSGSAWVAVSPKGVNKSLSDLTAPTAINQSLVPGISCSIDLGSPALLWKNAYFCGDGLFGDITVGRGGGWVNSNMAAGSEALISNGFGYNNTAIGSRALYSNYDGSNNTAIGVEALYSNYSSFASNFGSYNTAIGVKALYSSWDQGNTAVGAYALYNNTGYWNTALGAYADGGDLRNATAIGAGAIVDSWNKVRVGNADVTSIGGQVGWTSFSDGRYKKNIKEDVQGLAFIKSLKPITYTIDINGLNTYYDKNRKHDEVYDKMKKDMQPAADEAARIVYNGFMAQDVEAAAKKLNYEFSGVDKPKTKDGLYGLRYSDFVVPLVKAVQELSEQNDSLKTTNQSQQQLISNLISRLDKLEQSVTTMQQCSPCNASDANAQTYTVITDGASLQQNVPNPFSHSTTIGYILPQKFTTAQIMITDKSGKTIKLVNVSGSGKGNLNVDASVLASGAYNYSLLVDGKLIATKQMEHIK